MDKAIASASSSVKKTAPTSAAKTTKPRTPPSFQGYRTLKSYLIAHLMAFKISFRNVAIAPLTTFLSIAAIGACLTLPMGLYLFIKNIQQLSHGLDQGSALSLYIEPKSTPEQMEQILTKIKEYPFVEKVTQLTPEKALQEFKQTSGLQDILALLPENPLPAVISLQMNTRDLSPEILMTMKNTLAKLPGVKEASFDYEWVEKLQSFIALGTTLAHLLYAVIGLGVILMVGNTIRLALERHREEIEVLNLIGATKAFIRRPFLYRGALYGGLGGLIAALIISLMLACLKPYTDQLASLYHSVFTLENLQFYDTVTLLAASSGLGWLGAILAYKQQDRSLIPAIS